jgi:hypothetical protein
MTAASGATANSAVAARRSTWDHHTICPKPHAKQLFRLRLPFRPVLKRGFRKKTRKDCIYRRPMHNRSFVKGFSPSSTGALLGYAS